MWNRPLEGWTYNGCSWGPGLFGYGHGWGWLLNLLFWGLIIMALISLFRHLFSGASKGHGQNALSALKMRLASGEISKDEYEELRQTIITN